MLRCSILLIILSLSLASGLLAEYELGELKDNLLETANLMQVVLIDNLNDTSRGNLPKWWPIATNLSEDITIYFYKNEIRDNPTEYKLGNITELIRNDEFETSKKTVILVHGYLNDVSSPMIQLSLKALLTYQDVNILAVDWSQVMAKAYNVYTWCAEDTLPVGIALGKAVSSLITKGLNPSLLHLVGHSLGAHVVGITGNYLTRKNQTVYRITGLDPARVAFETVPNSQKIDATDADFVDCIHTCGGYLGFTRPLCQADFYPNGGLASQPGCSFLGDIVGICSHGRSYRYFAESIIPSHEFPAQDCYLTIDGLLGCRNSSQLMGYPAQSQCKGTFFVKTQKSYPFSPEVKHPPGVSWWTQLKSWILSVSIPFTNTWGIQGANFFRTLISCLQSMIQLGPTNQTFSLLTINR